MNLAISNIAWPHDQDTQVAELLQALDIRGVEIAPSKVWNEPLEATDHEIDEYRRFWNDHGIAVVAAQALLFGRPELTLFDADEIRRKSLEYLQSIIRLCGRLGCQSLVFGAPKNRRVGPRSVESVWPMAVDLFSRLARTAEQEGTCVVLEANPPQYGADFVIRAAEAIALVQAVDLPGLRLHLDTACMTLVADPIADVLATGMPLLRHFHVSEPNLQPIGGGAIDHAPFAEELRRYEYARWISIEMRESHPFTLAELADAISFTRRIY